jgi:hypothetical protein
MNLLTALEIVGNYPDNTRIESFKDENNLYGGIMYLIRDDGEIHRPIVSFEGIFKTPQEAETYLSDLAVSVDEFLNKHFTITLHPTDKQVES